MTENEIHLNLPNEGATLAFGKALAPVLRAGDAVLLHGDLGAGKSTLARGLIAALTGEANAPSPTYTLVETYEAPGFALWHFDLYRLDRADDIWELGFEEALDGGVMLIEWPERATSLMPADALVVRLSMADGDGRNLAIEASDEWARRLKVAGLA